jgi:branched-chain amino acid transport system substrate-binding protein
MTRPISFLFILACSAFFAFHVSFLHAEHIKIGLILPLTGEMASVGTACRDAARMALSEHGQGKAHSFELIIEDDALQPSKVAQAAQKLMHRDRVGAVISTWSYGGQIVSPIAERAKIPHIGVAWDSSIAKGKSNFLHLTPPEEFMSKFLEVFRARNIKRVALLGMEESGSVYALDVFSKLSPQYGVEVIFRQALPWTNPDFRSIVTKLKPLSPEYILINMGAQAYTEQLFRQLKEQRADIPVTAITAFDTISLHAMSDPKSLDGRWYVSDSYLPDDFSARFKKEYGHTLRYGIGNFYEAVRLLIDAYSQDAKGSPEKATEYLASLQEFDSIFGKTTVNAEGIFRYPAPYMVIKDGKREVIGFEELLGRKNSL